MIVSKDGHVSATGELEDLIMEVGTIVNSLGEAIKNIKNCTDEEREEMQKKFQFAMWYATMNPDNTLKPQGIVIEI